MQISQFVAELYLVFMIISATRSITKRSKPTQATVFLQRNILVSESSDLNNSLTLAVQPYTIASKQTGQQERLDSLLLKSNETLSKSTAGSATA